MSECGGCRKIKHASKEAAYAAWRRTGKVANIHVYWCKGCKAFHLGHTNSALAKMARINQLLDAR